MFVFFVYPCTYNNTKFSNNWCRIDAVEPSDACLTTETYCNEIFTQCNINDGIETLTDNQSLSGGYFNTSIQVCNDQCEPTTDISTAYPTLSIYKCDLESNTLMDDLNWTITIDLTQCIDNETGTFAVKVNVETKYIVGATSDTYVTYYGSATSGGFLGVAYVLDTNEFENHGRLSEDANTYANRLSSLFTGADFLEYGNQSICNIKMLESVYDSYDHVNCSHTFSLYDLWHDSSISLNLNFYLSILTPNTLLSHPLLILFRKQTNTVSNKDDVCIDLFTTNSIASTFIEKSILSNTSAIVSLTSITSVSYFMSLNIDIALVIGPTEKELITNSKNLDFTKDYYISQHYIKLIGITDDAVYTCLSINNNVSFYEIFGHDTSNETLSSCLDSSGIADTVLELTNIDSNISDTIEYFSFVLPPVEVHNGTRSNISGQVIF